jgi:hypothetical protein
MKVLRRKIKPAVAEALEAKAEIKTKQDNRTQEAGQRFIV